MAEAAKFESHGMISHNQKLATLLVRHLGTSRATSVCHANQWHGVLRAIGEHMSDFQRTTR